MPEVGDGKQPTPMLFRWFRTKVKVAILAGVEDALAELESGPAADTPDAAVARLRARLQPLALPAPVIDGNGPDATPRRKTRAAE
jgi:hypothetical protein